MNMMKKLEIGRRCVAWFTMLCLATMGLAGAPTVALAEQTVKLAETEWVDIGGVSTQADSTYDGIASYDALLTFGDDAITETVSGSGYSISGTTLEITAAGTYVLTGSCSEGSIAVKKNVSDVVLVLSDLTLGSSTTAPLVVKKTETATAETTTAIHLVGNSILTDNENSANETSSDAAVADAFEGACIKVKSGSNVTFCGSGNLTCVANAKNGIKGGSTSALTFNQSGTIRVTGSYSGTATSAGALNNGIASDGSLEFNQGMFDIDAANDGIKSAPDATDETEGTTIDYDSAGSVTINGGTFAIDVDGDAIQADTTLTINNGTFTISTLDGYNTEGTKYYTSGRTSSSYKFDPDSMSCKGLKASGDRSAQAVEEGLEGYDPTIIITGGTFTMNTADDAVHSDAYATVTGGTFTISSGDDGMHADTVLTLGTENSAIVRDPDVTINYSYEGLEGGTVYLYQGRYYICARDDGVNAAGGNDGSGDEPGGGGGFNPFNPGGPSDSTGDYNMYFYGGVLYVNCDGDGLDSNGGLYQYGGVQVVFSQQSGGDNSPFDSDGTWVIKGATVFGAGSNGMGETPASSSQAYTTSGSSGDQGSGPGDPFGQGGQGGQSASYSANTVISVTSDSTTVFTDKLPKAVNYLIYSNPSVSSQVSFTSGGSVSCANSNDWTHSWNNGSTANGVTTYTCSTCGATETQTVASTVSVDACAHEAVGAQADEGYTVTFAGDEGVESISVYYTQDYANASQTVEATGTTVSRDSGTGEADSTGSGQVNFTVNLAEGYSLSSVTVTEGTYKNLKDISSEAGAANTYRITKITADTTVTIETMGCEHAIVDEDSTPSASDDDDSSTTVVPATSVAAGVSLASVDAFLTARASDSDPAGSVFGKLRLKVAKVTKKTQKLAWSKVSGATKYVVYGNRCGKANKLVKLATVSGTTWTNGKLASGKYYKYLVVAVDSNNNVVCASKLVHAATKGGKVTNVKKVTLTNAKTGKSVGKVTLAKGKTVKLKAKVAKAAKKLTLKTHRAVKWESSNTSVAKVTASGKIKAVGKGTCYVCAYAQNGVFAKCKVTVK